MINNQTCGFNRKDKEVRTRRLCQQRASCELGLVPSLDRGGARWPAVLRSGLGDPAKRAVESDCVNRESPPCGGRSLIGGHHRWLGRPVQDDRWSPKPKHVVSYSCFAVPGLVISHPYSSWQHLLAEIS